MIGARCPRCDSSDIKEITDGYYECRSCGYKGTLGTNREIFKR